MPFAHCSEVALWQGESIASAFHEQPKWTNSKHDKLSPMEVHGQLSTGCIHPMADWEVCCKTVEPKSFVTAVAELNRLLESLANLMYLIRHDANYPTKIEIYVTQAERCLERAKVIVREQLRSYSPN